MNLNEHLQDRIKNSTNYVMTAEDKKIIQFEGIETFIYRKITSTKFRKTKMDEDSEKRVKEAIRINVSNNEPIKFTYPFGGYKIWRLPSYPNVDWAEFMTISYICRYIAPILQAYKYGVEISFSSDDVVIEQIDNYPRESLDKYSESFNNLIEVFKPYFPSNLKVELKHVYPDIYTSKEDYETELEQIVATMKKEGLTEDRKEKLRSVGFEFNFMKNGKIDFTKVSDEKYEKALEDLMYYSDGYLKLTKRRAFVRGEAKIVLFSNKIPNAIDIGSTTVSKAKFWAGMGVIEQDNDKNYERILTPKQWEANKDKITYEDTNLISLPNFNKIPVFKGRFNFLA